MPRGSSDASSESTAASKGIERAAIDLVRYALACNASGKAIKREAIRDQVLSGQATRNTKQIIDRANELLNQSFGLRLTSLPQHEKTLHGGDAEGTTQVSKIVNRWVLQSTLPNSAREKLQLAQSEKDKAVLGFAATVLSLIFVNNMSIPTDQLVMYVRKLGPPHHVLCSGEHVGDDGTLAYTSDAQLESAAREAVEYLVRQGYLDKVSIHASGRMGSMATQATQATQQQGDAGGSDAEFEYTWGPQAKVKFEPLDMARFIAAMTGQECDAEFVKTISRAYGRSIDYASLTTTSDP
ncbi:hypothetical protein GGI25_006262 [Coemansia spiralis]|uniref:MAGE domain-containing protein n=2 Tax=Coemansia TaxID=4863 RepID=A0A9W8G0R1_9FUNG|nr:MAGE family-domain-containing protein [Coemansia spiralis]KAJ1995626.1 hypothetical protein EDC05_000864 [Coemansia umbellata]KAJ2625043.1 hypothetical protein GGI26_000846 [Coemansia sp. RSA 1358]KAJ2669087.1 hypothetical protein GGI25_006262 [Coemansia spiralis]